MNIRLTQLVVRTRQTIERIDFSKTVTFLYGPVGTGKSTVARLIDYCFGGDLERTPAIQQEFVSVVLGATLGEYECTLERGDEDTQSVRVTWSLGKEDIGSVNAPLSASEALLPDTEVYNLSDLLFHLCGVEPIKVLRRSRDPNSPLVRLSFRDIWRYCYLDQALLDSSFFRLDDPFRGRKSQDAMRFFTGLHSERLSQLQADYYRAISEKAGAREAVIQIREFMSRFGLGSELELTEGIEILESDLRAKQAQKQTLETERATDTHPTDEMKSELRELSLAVADLQEAIDTSQTILGEQEALKAELITAKLKAGRAEQAGQIFEDIDYSICPQCGSDLSMRPAVDDQCRLCGTPSAATDIRPGLDTEVIRRELNDRIDQISDSMNRKRQALERSERELQRLENTKRQLDRQLQDALQRYDSAFVEKIRIVDREIATLEERFQSLMRLQEMSRAIGELEERAGASQGIIDRLRFTIEEERSRLRSGDENARAIAEKFKAIMLDVGLPGVSDEDDVLLDPRDWKPVVVHAEQKWGFWETGSGGKKTLFNVCYALAVHEVAHERGMPVPSILIIDSPTKNISDDENPELVQSLYREIYRSATAVSGIGTQFLIIDSDLVEPTSELIGFSQKRMAGTRDAPSLISYYDGP
ncbi:AAA family ATPase [Imhoffiella purpurea]|uniref:Rad50/SbcC-type AAA domain-containing protein n=1 Tax=Imhoffiella purpurea TaxID=1249627 RepID=W9VFZ8_9GAMM|nr:AAA family ATPase [Imhoffiella purpurea]EXJ14962.1 hypothetical protein D779_1972 [Imhoffiella purpurea]